VSAVLSPASTKVTLLGTGSPLPTAQQAGPATLVQAGDAVLLVDCGRAVVMRLVAAGVVPAGLSAVLLTHLHSDHITDLNDVITTHWVMTGEPRPLRVFGPPGTQRVVDGVLAMLALDQGYRQAHHADLRHPMAVTVTEVDPGKVLAVGGARIIVQATDHRPVAPTVGYRVEHAGTAVALGGDSVPCPGLDELCAGADVYVQTVLRADLIGLVNSSRLREIVTYHSTIEQAAQTAARAGVRIFLPTHFLPAIAPGDEDAWRRRAAAHFRGEIVIGGDLTTVTVGPNADPPD
jgi:ribonuclease Z